MKLIIGCTRIVIIFEHLQIPVQRTKPLRRKLVWPFDSEKLCVARKTGIPYLYFLDEEMELQRLSDLITAKQRVPGRAEIHLGLMNLRHFPGPSLILHLVGTIRAFFPPGKISTRAYSTVQGRRALTCALNQQLLLETRKGATDRFWILYLIQPVRSCFPTSVLPHCLTPRGNISAWWQDRQQVCWGEQWAAPPKLWLCGRTWISLGTMKTNQNSKCGINERLSYALHSWWKRVSITYPYTD